MEPIEEGLKNTVGYIKSPLDIPDIILPNFGIFRVALDRIRNGSSVNIGMINHLVAPLSTVLKKLKPSVIRQEFLS